MADPRLVVTELTHEFHSAGKTVTPLENLSFEIQKGKILAVRGPSGSGKTTLLLSCGGMRAPTRGKVTIGGNDLYAMSSAARVSFRAEEVGYLFQTLELIPYLNVFQNVRMAKGVKDATARRWLERLGLADRLAGKPNALSHGERQRVALARAIAHQPSIVICDEPTGNLDPENTEMVFAALREFADQGGTVLVASHDSAVDDIADEILMIGDHSDSKFETPSPEAQPPRSSKMNRQAASRSGSVSRLLLFMLGSIMALIGLGLAVLNLRPDAARSTSESDKVRIYCAAGVAKPVEQAVQIYNASFAGNVEIIRTGGSGELAGQIKTEFETGVKSSADLYLSADDLLLEKAHREEIIAERFPVAEQRPVIAVRADSSFDLKSLRSLTTTSKLKFGLASNQAAVGKIVRKIAQRHGFAEELDALKTTDAENVMTLAQALSTGSLDAAVIWDTTVSQVNQFEEKQQLKIACFADEQDLIKSNIAIGVVNSTQSPTSALKFCRFLSGSAESKQAFEKFGFRFVQGDTWEEVPEIHLYCGSMFSPVLEDSIRDFGQREGINIYPRWQGCGKLVASIEGTQDPALFPDAFLACDISFLEKVETHFEPCSMVSSNDIVLAVRKGYESKVKSPGDLVSSGLRFGICDPHQSALGTLTQKLLSKPPYEDLYPEINDRANVIVDVGPTLISQLMAAGLDAAIVYRSNVMADTRAASMLNLVEIESGFAKARQPWAIAKETRNAQLMARLFEWISRNQTKSRFEKFGFSQVFENN